MVGDKVKYYKMNDKIVRLKTDINGNKHVEEWDDHYKYFSPSITLRVFDVEVRGVEMNSDEILRLGIA